MENLNKCTDDAADVVLQSQTAFQHRLGWAESTKVLEQFRYTIIASQLLNERPNLGIYHRSGPQSTTDREITRSGAVRLNSLGLSITLGTAFLIAWLTHRVRSVRLADIGARRALCYFTILIGFLVGGYYLISRKWAQHVRELAIHHASILVAGAQDFDVTASSAVIHIQEVELVSRGYRV